MSLITLSKLVDIFQTSLQIKEITYEANEITLNKASRTSYGETHQVPVSMSSEGIVLTLFDIEFSVNEFNLFTNSVKEITLQLEKARQSNDFSEQLSFIYHFQREEDRSIKITFLVDSDKDNEIVFRFFKNSLFAYDQLEQLNYEFKEFANLDKYFNFA